jgi:acyl-CoA synthetase (AMP-forming)/AMP-acid ligase II
MLALFDKLYRTHLLTPAGMLQLFETTKATGINLIGLLQITAKLHPQRIAVIDAQKKLTYSELYQQSKTLARHLLIDYGLSPRKKVAVICRNHIALLKTIVAISHLGADIYLLNPEMSADQILYIATYLRFDFYVYDPSLADVFKHLSLGNSCTDSLGNHSLPSYHPTEPCIDKLSLATPDIRDNLPKVACGKIWLMGEESIDMLNPLSQALFNHQQFLANFLPAFLALLTQAQLNRYRSVYIAAPMYQAFGVASLLFSLILGMEMYFTASSDPSTADLLIDNNNIELMLLRPFTLQQMLNQKPSLLAPLKCIITGGAVLSPTLAKETLQQVGPKLFSLYGTAETGFCALATSDGLRRKPQTMGKPLHGVPVKIVDEEGAKVGVGKVGHLLIQSPPKALRNRWLETGHLAYRDVKGNVIYCGRVDDMIVSAGVRIYPIDLEYVLMQHPDLEAATVIAISIPKFGQRLKAVVQKKPGSRLNQASLRDWLKSRLAPYEMPTILEFRDQLPYTMFGELDRKALRE